MPKKRVNETLYDHDVPSENPIKYNKRASRFIERTIEFRYALWRILLLENVINLQRDVIRNQGRLTP